MTKFQSPFLKGVGVPFIVPIVGGKLIGPKLVRFLPDVSWNGKPSVSPRLPQDPILVIQAPLLSGNLGPGFGLWDFCIWSLSFSVQGLVDMSLNPTP